MGYSEGKNAYKFASLNFYFRLKDEKMVTLIVDKVQEHLERQSLSAELCRIYLRKIEHLYYKFDPDVLKQKQVK
jgi:translation initiation factor 3 subunit C